MYLPHIKNVYDPLKIHQLHFATRLREILPHLMDADYPVSIPQYYDGQGWKTPKGGPVSVASFYELVKIMAEGRLIHGHKGWSLFYTFKDNRQMPDVFAREFDMLPTLDMMKSE